MSGAAEAVPIVRGPQRRSMQMWDGDVSYLAWEEASPKAPALHFAHANGFNALTYRWLLGGLASGFRVYASDLRGHGLTTLAANPRGMQDWLIYRTTSCAGLRRSTVGPNCSAAIRWARPRA